MSARTGSTGGRELLDDEELTLAPRRVDRRRFESEFPSGDATATECAQNLIRTAQLFMDADLRGLRRHGLSIPARILLATLDGSAEPLSHSAIGERLFVTGASVTSLVDTLERRGLVTRTRDQTDRRLVLVELTAQGRAAVDAFLPEVTALHAAEFSVLDETEREQLVVLLAKVAAAIERLDVDAVTSSARPRNKSVASSSDSSGRHK